MRELLNYSQASDEYEEWLDSLTAKKKLVMLEIILEEIEDFEEL